jgi:hypothetical protein
MSKFRTTTADQELAAKALLLRGISGKTQIFNKLIEMNLLTGENYRSPRTIGRMVDRLKPANVSGPWSFAEETNPEDAGLALEVLAQVYDRTDGRVWLTKELAAWVIRLRRAAPDMPASWAYVLAWQYSAATTTQGEQDERPMLDLVFALQPWAIRGGVGGEVMSGFGGDRAIIRWWDEDRIPAFQRLWPLIDELDALVKDIERVPRPVFSTPSSTPMPANNGEQAGTQQHENP